eukprot:4596145-Amphidinium_carterae.1
MEKKHYDKWLLTHEVEPTHLLRITRPSSSGLSLDENLRNALALLEAVLWSAIGRVPEDGEPF